MTFLKFKLYRLFVAALLVPMSFLMLSRCSEIFEVELDGATVEVIMPVDSLVTPVAMQSFWWESVDGASHYLIQVVSPRFDSVLTAVVDERVDTNKFETTLEPGEYQWRVKAKNSASESPWITHSLFIDSTVDLSAQSVVLDLPTQNDTSNTLAKTFTWQDLYNVDTYELEVWQPDLNGTLVESKTTTAHQEQVMLHQEGAYVWRVKGENSFGSTGFSQSAGYVDTTAPGAPVLLSPLDNTIIQNGQVNFSWQRPVNNGSSIKDSLVVATDSTFIQVHKNYILSGTTKSDSLSTGVYYWKVYSKDKAGNLSASSQKRKITVQ